MSQEQHIPSFRGISGLAMLLTCLLVLAVNWLSTDCIWNQLEPKPQSAPVREGLSYPDYLKQEDSILNAGTTLCLQPR